MVNWLSLAVPLAYLGVVLGSLATFSSLYRKRKAKKAASLEAWFPPHLQRDIYFSLMHLEPPASNNNNKEKKTPAIPESVLKAALLRRAEEDVRRVMALRSQKQALAMLLQRGSVGDDLWQRFLRAEKEIEDEVRDVVTEANAFVPNWGQTIFQSANEMMNNDVYRRRLAEHQSKLAEERQWWEKKKASIQEGFMKELDGDKASAGTKEAQSAAAAPAARLAPSSVQGSDDDGVLVEADPAPTSAPPAQPASTAGGGKKKKGKGKK